MGAWLWSIIIIILLSFLVFLDQSFFFLRLLMFSLALVLSLTHKYISNRMTLCHVSFLLLSIAMLKDKSMPTHKSDVNFVQSIYHVICLPANEMCIFCCCFVDAKGRQRKSKKSNTMTERKKDDKDEKAAQKMEYSQREFVVLGIFYFLVINVCHSSFIDLAQVCSFNVFSIFFFGSLFSFAA